MAVVTLNGDPRSSRPTFCGFRRFVVKQDWEGNPKEGGENTQDEKRRKPRPESEGQTSSSSSASSTAEERQCATKHLELEMAGSSLIRRVMFANCAGKDGCGDTQWRPTLVASHFLRVTELGCL